MLAFLDKIPYGTPRLRRWVFWLLTAFVCYTLFGFLAVPPILKSVLTTQLAENLKRPARIEKVYFNPLLLRLEIDGLAVSKLKGEGDLIAAGQIAASPSIATLWHFAPVISCLKFRDLTLDVTFFGNGRYSVSDLMETGQNDSPPEQEGAVFPFALYDFELANATLVFDDRSHDKRHVISEINLRVPYTSSFEGTEKEFTQPTFTAVVNGDPVELEGRARPFDQTLLTEFRLGAVDVGLDQYWRYLPVKTPLTLKSGRFTSDISLFFERPDAHSLNLFVGGGGRLTNLDLEDPDEGSVIRLKELAFDIERFSLRDRFVALKSVTVQDPYFKVVRTPGGTINWAGYFTPLDAEPADDAAAAEPEAAPFRVDCHRAEVHGGSVEWIDRAVKGGFTRTFGNLEVAGSELASRGGTPGAFEASIGSAERFSVKGTATIDPLAVKATVAAQDVSLPDFAPYLAEAQPLAVDSGTAGLGADVDFTLVEGAPKVTVANGSLTLADLAARKPDAKEPSLGLGSLAVSGASLDLDAKSVTVDEIALNAPMATIVRQKDGSLDLVALLAPKDAVTPAQAEASPAQPAQAWAALVRRVAVADGSFTFRDRQLKNAASLGVRRFALEITDAATAEGAAIPYTASGAWTGGGDFSTQGTATLDPVTAKGRFKLADFGLRPFDAYLAESTELLFAKGRAYASLAYDFTQGETPAISARGDAALAGLAVKTTFADSEFVGLDRLDVKSIDFKNNPNELTIGEISLDGPRALVEFAENGRLNIRRALRIPEPEPVSEEDAEKAEAEKQEEAKGTETDDAEAIAAEEEPPLFARLDIGKVSMTNGALHFRDASVQPVFTNDVRKMTLSLTDIGMTPEARPKIDFTAEVGPTPLSVTGVLNPVITPIYSDLAIAVNGMELVPLSPYTVKNLAYPIEKGRLYADVTFKTEDWKLDAQNKFFIEQLVLGPKDKRPDAPSVPVKFGLALLQDGNGDLELNLPIAGRLDDPNFRIGGIVFRAIVGLLFKALASPFTLIGSIFGGGGQDMDFLVFEPGRARIDQNGEAKLATVIKALTERQKLKLEVDGVIDPKADASGLTQVLFDRKIKAQKYDDQPRSVRAETTVDDMVVAPEEYPEYLFEAYADEPDEEDVRPTTLFMVDEQPVEVMEKFIRDRIVITGELLHELAMRRANAIKSYIIERNPELAERVFLVDREDAQGKTGVPAHRADLGIN